MTKKIKFRLPKLPNFRPLISLIQKNTKLSINFLNKRQVLKNCLVFGSLGLAFIFLLLSMLLFQVNDRFAKGYILFRIEANDTTTAISYKLQREHVIPNIISFRVISKLFRVENKFHLGEYKLSPKMNLLKIVNTLQEKGALSINSGTSVTVPEGYTLNEIAEVLETKGICTKKAFLAAAYNIKRSELADKYPFLKDMPISFPEGYLFPDTYILPQNSSPNIVLDIMLGRFNKMITPLLPEISRNKLTLHQIITLASIVEKETGNRVERRLIAGVYLNRLEKMIHLGSCPTVKYALGKPHLPYLLYKHLNVISPYNTYRHYGLPPGPIGSPGLASILAALKPERTDYLYFVAKGDGTHIFTSTLKEHLSVQEEMLKKNEGKIY
jgi:UPF0755 protein